MEKSTAMSPSQSWMDKKLWKCTEVLRKIYVNINAIPWIANRAIAIENPLIKKEGIRPDRKGNH